MREEGWRKGLREGRERVEEREEREGEKKAGMGGIEGGEGRIRWEGAREGRRVEGDERERGGYGGSGTKARGREREPRKWQKGGRGLKHGGGGWPFSLSMGGHRQ